MVEAELPKTAPLAVEAPFPLQFVKQRGAEAEAAPEKSKPWFRQRALLPIPPEEMNAEAIAGAGLDTYWKEPLPKENPFWGMKNVIVSPHVAGMSDIYVEQALTIFEENLRRFIKGEKQSLLNVVKW